MVEERVEEELRRELGRRIVRRREELGWSQNELSRRLGVPRSRVSRWESGAHAPSLDGLRELSGVLGITADELLTGDDPLARVRETVETLAGWLDRRRGIEESGGNR